MLSFGAKSWMFHLLPTSLSPQWSLKGSSCTTTSFTCWTSAIKIPRAVALLCQMYKNNVFKICNLMQEMTKEKENKSESHVDNFV